METTNQLVGSIGDHPGELVVHAGLHEHPVGGNTRLACSST